VKQYNSLEELMNRWTKVGILAAVAAMLAGGVAAANRCGYGHGHVGKVIDGALDAAKVTPAQRNAIEAARDHVFATIEEAGHDQQKDMQEAIALFSAPVLDAQAVEAHRARKEAEIKKVSDAVVQSIFDTHAALTPPQRKAVADYLRAEKAKHEQKAGSWHETFFQKLIDNRTQAAFDAIDATDAQKTALTAARDKVIGAFKDVRTHGPAVDKLLDLFTADTLDRAQITALQADVQARLKRVGDAMTQALTDAHAQLSAEQRQKLVDWVKAHHRDHHKWQGDAEKGEKG
jgi:Spy/CpxP family protein refolding chaperone